MEGSSGSNGGESSLTRWEKKERLSGNGHRDRVVVTKKNRTFFKAERHRDENELTILGAWTVRVSLLCSLRVGMGTRSDQFPTSQGSAPGGYRSVQKYEIEVLYTTI
jgi:hypothetical protein